MATFRLLVYPLAVLLLSTLFFVVRTSEPPRANKEVPGKNGAPEIDQANDPREQDFKDRCAAEGVLTCMGWDSPADFEPPKDDSYSDGLYPAADGSFQGAMDTVIKTSGSGSLRFTIRPGVVPNSAGYWRANFGPSRKKFGPHSALYFQFRLRLSPEMLNFKWDTVSDTGWKVFIAYGPIPGPSCTGAQFVQENTYQTNVATAYTSCGTPPLYTNNGNPPMLIQQGDYNCPYRHEGGYGSNRNCFSYLPDTWMSEYWVVEIGDFGAPNTHFTAEIGLERQPLKRFIDLPNFRFNSNAEAGDGLQSILLQPYFSGASGKKKSPTAYMWFDELIVSTRPIAPPKY